MRGRVFPLPIRRKLNKPLSRPRFIHRANPLRTPFNASPSTPNKTMTPIQILAPSVIAIILVSCASQKADMYDTADPYGAPDAGYADAAPAYENPIYDTPAAYEESGPAPSTAYQPPASTASGSGTATVHTVVRGDTLSGLSRKYNVPMESIKRANNMTNDIVVLGRKMVIPAN
jgi:hypothetical protein